VALDLFSLDLLDEEEYLRWVEMARRTLRSAERDLEGGDHNWACFKAHHAAGCAVKGLAHGLGMGAHGHSVSALLAKLPRELGVEDLMDDAKLLDKYYVPTRYPDAWSEGVPADYYTRAEAEQALLLARKLVGWVEDRWASLRRG
jgi:HEPN domain-containing protein